jgi:hypothetical protein
MTPCFVVTVECHVNHSYYVQNRLKAFHMSVDFFIVFQLVAVS